MKGGNIVNFKEKLLYMGLGFLFASAGYMLANWQIFFQLLNGARSHAYLVAKLQEIGI